MSIQPANISPSYKQKVAARFSKAAQTYDDYAAFQEVVLNQLFAMVNVSQTDDVWLDLGTGTGRALSLFASAETCPGLLAADISHSMLQQAQGRMPEAHFICGDAEALPLKSQSLDGIFSSLALQWCLNQEVLFDELHRVLKQDGELVFATLLQDSMPELNQAWQQVDGCSHQNQYLSYDELLQICRRAGFQVVQAQQNTITSWFPCVRDVVDSLKKVGASLIKDGAAPISPGKWRNFETQYERYREEQGLPLSYRVAFIRLKKVNHG